MIIYIICSVLFWIAAVVLSFVNGMGYCKVQTKYYRNIFGKIKAKKTWRDRLFEFSLFGLPVVLCLIGIWIF
jgi:hypothetical protein